MPRDTDFGSRQQHLIDEYREATDNIRNSFYKYAIEDLEGSSEFLQLQEDVMEAGERYLQSIGNQHTIDRYELLEVQTTISTEEFYNGAHQMNEDGLMQTEAALTSLKEFSETISDSNLESIETEIDLLRNEHEIRKSIADLGLPPADTEAVSEIVFDAIYTINNEGVQGATDYIRSQLEELQELRTIEDEYYGLHENIDPVTVCFIGTFVAFSAVGLYYCVYKNDVERCEGLGRLIDHITKIPKIFNPFQKA